MLTNDSQRVQGAGLLVAGLAVPTMPITPSQVTAGVRALLDDVLAGVVGTDVFDAVPPPRGAPV